MSRSYKKNPCAKDNGDKKAMKQIANRTVRRHVKMDEDIPSRLQHKKMTESWDITDYKNRMTREEAIQRYNELVDCNPKTRFMKRFPTLESWLNYWEKCYRRK